MPKRFDLPTFSSLATLVQLHCERTMLVNWSEATPEDHTGFRADILCEELSCRNLDTAGTKEEIINQLIANIDQNRSTPLLPSPNTSAPSQHLSVPLPSSFDAALRTGLLQQLLDVSQRAAVTAADWTAVITHQCPTRETFR